jgi:DNA polymerase-3 subunit alpha
VNYFLVIADWVRFARDAGISMGPGRGPASGSVAAFALGITDIDPLRHGLVFECLLDPARPAPPDIDLEVCAERRGEMLAYLRRRYGEDRTACLSAFAAWGPRPALRETGRALGLDPGILDRAAGRVPDAAAGGLKHIVPGELAPVGAVDPDVLARWVSAAKAWELQPRTAAQHPSGVLVGDGALEGAVPLLRGHEGHAVCQWDAGSLDACGFIKLDAAGLRAVTVLSGCGASAERAGGGAEEMEECETTSREALVPLREQRLAGVYHLDTPVFRDLLSRVGPVTSFPELVALVTLCRPSMAREAVVYCAGGQEPDADLPRRLREVLSETRGLLLYDEQVVRILAALTGWDPSRAESLRRAWLSREKHTIRLLHAAYLDGARHRRIPRAQAEAAYVWIAERAGSVASGAHHTAAAALAWRMLTFKARHPAAFYAAAASEELSGSDARAQSLFREIRDCGLRLRPPDINRSDIGFRVEPDGGIRWGLAAVRQVTVETARIWVEERVARGPFRNLEDFCARIIPAGLPRRALENLIAGGAFDFTGISRERLMNEGDIRAREAQRLRREAATGQMTLFDRSAAVTLSASNPAPWTPERRRKEEESALGWNPDDPPPAV